MGLSLEFLGTGDSAQVPVYNCLCVACRRARADSRFRRRPCSAVVRIAGQQWLIDGGRMDLAERFPAPMLTGILQTHYHPDHAQGLLHLRWGVNMQLPVWGPVDEVGFADLYKHPGILDFSQPWRPFESRRIAHVTVTAVPLQHSRPCMGYVFESAKGRVAYLTDTVGLAPETQAWLAQRPLRYCIVDCTHPPQATPPRNHNDVPSALAMCAELDIEQVYLTHISHEMDQWLETHADELPSHVQVARDGMFLFC
ncbi:MAG TPA: phosphonate metabolism protein PhnP [Paenalcaligenes hominis]|uniref:Phosphonate metabolism protein PhnP n=1 Tax=Paenalcaligenes hominis TaxID=643674 RepID=A0A9D2VH26_9BURK|nr:phosphonate metabolism protein PhnP [Paenalcaligenes hominis]